jgi:hypothetical protein
MSAELTQWVRQLCATTVPASSMSTLADRCVGEGVYTVGQLLAAALSEADLKALGLADYAVTSHGKCATGRTDGGKGRLAAVAPDSNADGGDGEGEATSAAPQAAAAAAVAGRLCAVGMGLGIGIGVGLAMGSLVALKIVRASGVKGKDALGLMRR